MITRRARWASGLVCLVSAVTMIGAGAMNKAVDQPAQVGEPAPDFTLTDLEGREHTLSEYTKAGNIVVLEWFNPTCPFVRKHYREDTMTMVKMQEELKAEKIVWLRINSAHEGHVTAGIELNKDTAEDWGITTPILRDLEGTVGRAYGAKRTPEMYVIAASGVLEYHGAIDNNPDSVSPGEKNYVRAALSEVLAGEECSKPTSKAYGCSVKY